MRKAFSFLFLFFLIMPAFAQTKLIAHKSHSGSNTTFTTVMCEGLGLGLPPKGHPMTTVTKPALQKVIYVSDSVAVTVFNVEYTTTHFEEKGVKKETKITVDTVYNHPLFSHQHSLDSIRTVVDQQKYIYHPVRKVKFVGYDNKRTISKDRKTKKSDLLPLLTEDNHNPPFDFHLLLWVSYIAVFSILAGLLSWKLYQAKLLIQKI